jgi:hypothetical protein
MAARRRATGGPADRAARIPVLNTTATTSAPCGRNPMSPAATERTHQQRTHRTRRPAEPKVHDGSTAKGDRRASRSRGEDPRAPTPQRRSLRPAALTQWTQQRPNEPTSAGPNEPEHRPEQKFRDCSTAKGDRRASRSRARIPVLQHHSDDLCSRNPMSPAATERTHQRRTNRTRGSAELKVQRWQYGAHCR